MEDPGWIALSGRCLLIFNVLYLFLVCDLGPPVAGAVGALYEQGVNWKRVRVALLN